MSAQIIRNEQSLERSSRAMPTSALKNGKLKVFIPYDGSESSDTALANLRRAGLPQGLEALVAVTQVWLPLSPYEITQSVTERFWQVGSKASLVAVRKSGRPRDPGGQSETGLALERQADRLRATGLEVSIGIKYGQPEDVLLREARDLLADCIFIEAHGLGRRQSDGSDRRGLGKAVEAILLGAHCSVEIVRSKNLTGQYLQPAA
jgi:nucleotide-binding universal stress UspA family protein